MKPAAGLWMNQARRYLLRGSPTWILASLLTACGGGGGGGDPTGVETQAPPELPAPISPGGGETQPPPPGQTTLKGGTVIGLYTWDADRNSTQNGPQPVTIKMFILDNGRFYAISLTDKQLVKNFYFGNGVETRTKPGIYSFNSNAILKLPMPDTGAVPPVETAALSSFVAVQNQIYDGVMDGMERLFRVAYEQEFNSVVPSLANVVLPPTHRYSGNVVVGDIGGQGDIKGLGIVVENKSVGMNLIIQNGCDGQSGSLQPRAKGNFYDVSFSLKYGVKCGSNDVFTGHAIVEKNDKGDPAITIMAVNHESTKVLNYSGFMTAAP
jgi:hypothetical protein